MANRTKAQERAAREAALKEEQRRKAKRMMVVKVAGIALAMVAIVGIGFWVSSENGGSTDGEVPAVGASDYGLTLGDPDAPHEVVIYEDFLCPFCGELERATSDRLEKLAEEGAVYLEYRPYVLLDRIGPYSEDATSAFAVVQQEAGDEVAVKFHQLLFENQPAEDASSFPGDEELIDLAVEAGAEEDAIREGIEDDAGSDWADGATDEAQDNGIEGTPTVLLDGQLFQEGTNIVEVGENLIATLEESAQGEGE